MSDVQPIPGLDSIADPAVRTAMQALANGWAVRNGDVGDGTKRFVTADELAAGTITIFGVNNAGGNNNNGADGGGSMGEDIQSIIADLTSQIFASKLWQDLGARIDVLDNPSFGLIDAIVNTGLLLNARAARIDSVLAATGNALAGMATSITAETTEETALFSGVNQMLARVGNAVAGINTETQLRVSADDALASQITSQIAQVNQNVAQVKSTVTTVSNSLAAVSTKTDTVQANLNNAVASVQQNATATASSIQGLSAQYSVKIDVSGYVTGFGLSSTPVNGVPVSEFYVRADRFAVGQPGVSKVVPFIIEGGRVIMDSAFVRKLEGTDIRGATIRGGDIRGGFIGGGTLSQTTPATIVSIYDPAVTNPEAQGAFTYRCLLTLNIRATSEGFRPANTIKAGAFSVTNDLWLYVAGGLVNNGSLVRVRDTTIDELLIESTITNTPTAGYSYTFEIDALSARTTLAIYSGADLISSFAFGNGDVAGAAGGNSYTRTPIYKTEAYGMMQGSPVMRTIVVGYIFRGILRDVRHYSNQSAIRVVITHSSNQGGTVKSSTTVTINHNNNK